MAKQDGTHTLTLEFSRSDNYNIDTSLAGDYDKTQITAEFVDEVLIKEITENFSPEEIFGEDCLNDWAIDNMRGGE